MEFICVYVHNMLLYSVEDELSCTDITVVAASFIGHNYESMLWHVLR